uniref:c-type heme family protein n=1 Tax=uncultured Draconibacterium sp. TaxID=1573823 RepID=UPI003216429E
MKVNTICFLIMVFFFSCNQGIDSSTYLKIRESGNEISGKVQATLLSNVGTAIQYGGAEHAVEFCNLKAGAIVDSLNHEFDCKITRITNKTRNAENGLSSSQEMEFWKIFEANTLADTVVKEANALVFYKPIRIGMPACLKCHGNTESDIDTATRQKLRKLYPNDLATGYRLNDLRGLWKIEFEKK